MDRLREDLTPEQLRKVANEYWDIRTRLLAEINQVRTIVEPKLGDPLADEIWQIVKPGYAEMRYNGR